MDVTTDKDLFNFVENLGKEEEGTTITTVVDAVADSMLQSNNDENICSNNNANQQESSAANLWEDIANALEDWTQRVLDVESRHSKVINFQQTIENSLLRQQLDGFLCSQDLSELRYIATLWIDLLNASSCYNLGCIFVKKNILSILLELYTLKQISNDLFIDACLKL